MITETSPWCIAPAECGSLTIQPSPGLRSVATLASLAITCVPISEEPTWNST